MVECDIALRRQWLEESYARVARPSAKANSDEEGPDQKNVPGILPLSTRIHKDLNQENTTVIITSAFENREKDFDRQSMTVIASLNHDSEGDFLAHKARLGALLPDGITMPHESQDEEDLSSGQKELDYQMN
jgi:hypothetical protein